MDLRDAEALLAAALPAGPGVWIDFGAVSGTFTRALANRLGAGSRVYAVDRDRRAVASLRGKRWMRGIEIVPVLSDFTKPSPLPGLTASTVDGMLFANSLHFVAQPEVVLVGLVPLIRPGGSVVIIEYDGRRANRWVPHPIPSNSLADVLATAGLPAPAIVAERPSAYGGSLYVAVAKRPV